MATQSTRLQPHFSAADVRRLRDHLSRKTVAAYWEAGRIQNSKFDGRANYGGLAALERRLKRRAGDAPVSADQLHKCRVLARVWDRGDVAAAKRAGLPWFRVIVVIFILTLADKIPDQRQRRSITRHCKTLTHAYPPSDDEKARARWINEIAALKVQCVKRQPARMTRRLFNEKRLAVQHRLDDLRRRMKAAHAMLPRTDKRKGHVLLAHVETLKARVTDFYTTVEFPHDD